MRVFTGPVPDAVIKGLFRRLVKTVGGVEASAAFLGISHQRVSQLSSVQTTDHGQGPVADEHQPNMPTWAHVTSLEAACGQPVVTEALSRAAKGQSISSDPLKEAGDVIINGTRLFDMVREKAAPEAIKAAIIEHRRELAELEDSVDGSAA